MSFKVFRKALDLCSSYVSIGGGEPTLHRDFWKMVAYALGTCDDGVWLATNGSRREDSLVLAKLAQRGVLGVALSRDEFHDDIHEDVVKAFSGIRPRMMTTAPNDLREIRNVSKHIYKMGRAAETKCWNIEDQSCGCGEFLVKPKGDIYFCQCEDAAKVGDVFKGVSDSAIEIASEYDGCWFYYKSHCDEYTKGVTYA